MRCSIAALNQSTQALQLRYLKQERTGESVATHEANCHCSGCSLRGRIGGAAVAWRWYCPRESHAATPAMMWHLKIGFFVALGALIWSIFVLVTVIR